jgi:hypothetical protein
VRNKPHPVLENFRLWDGPYGSRPGELHGMFVIKDSKDENADAVVILSSGHDRKYGWEHVSVSLADRVPTWALMCSIKEMFWDDDECVVQYHPPKRYYVNHHPHCLHLWKPTRKNMPMPPTILIGPQLDREAYEAGKAAADRVDLDVMITAASKR